MSSQLNTLSKQNIEQSAKINVLSSEVKVLKEMIESIINGSSTGDVKFQYDENGNLIILTAN